MCGIVGITGKKHVKAKLLHSLERLEYRGYDSSGIAIGHGFQIDVWRAEGRLVNLREKVADVRDGYVGIGHTRWATHGAPVERNAHPHRSASGRFVVVHNGVIENEKALRLEHFPGHEWQSETDTEIIAQLMEKHVDEGMSVGKAFRQTTDLLHGSFAIAMMDADNPGVLYVAKRRSPLLIGRGIGFHVVTSDANVVLEESRNFVELADGDIAIVSPYSLIIQDASGHFVSRPTFEVETDPTAMDKGAYPHYMLKEIDEQPAVLRRIVGHYEDVS
ncbi:MAG: glutamine--fructose-6-phosphate transaminase (isomerizing), partial [Bacilli bacterium]